VPTICDFVDKLNTPGSKELKAWMADKTPQARLQVAEDFGLAGQDLQMCKKALQTKNGGQAVEHHCSKPQGTWVK
jgi:hypothetical protein